MSDKEEDKGICFFAYNNEEIDYVKLAQIAAGYVKVNMSNNKTCLITDKGTYDYFQEAMDSKFRDACFDQVVLTNAENAPNPRRHYDSPWTEFTAQFNNSNKHKIFEYTPFEKTLLLDIDYIVKNNFYDYIFDTEFPLAMHRESQYLQYEAPYMNEITLADGGIHHWWSTVIYFDQSVESKTFFDTWAHVKDNWDYYHLLYQFPPALFRTDFCVSIACHLLNGYNENNFVHDFLGTKMRNMDQKDELHEIKSLNDWIFFSHVRKEVWKNILVRNQDLNIHVMNKRALTRHAEPILEFLKEEIL